MTDPAYAFETDRARKVAGLERRRRTLTVIIHSPALQSDARAGDREAADAIADARMELDMVQAQIEALEAAG